MSAFEMLAFFRFIKFYNEEEITMVSVRKRGKVYEYRFEIIIRKATINDIPAISTIKVKGRQTAYKGLIDDDYLNRLLWVNKDLSKETISQERILATLYFTRRKLDKRLVGNLQIRHYLDEKLLKYGGHIGDSVRPSERKKDMLQNKLDLLWKNAKN